MSDCTHIDRINAYHDGELVGEQRVAMEQHIAGGCAACSKELESLQRLSLKLRELETSQGIPSPLVSKLHRQVDSMSDRSILHFAELLSGIAAALLLMTSIWTMRTPSASAAPMVEWERAAVTLHPEMGPMQQPGSLHAAEWIVNDLASGAQRDE